MASDDPFCSDDSDDSVIVAFGLVRHADRKDWSSLVEATATIDGEDLRAVLAYTAMIAASLSRMWAEARGLDNEATLAAVQAGWISGKGSDQ